MTVTREEAARQLLEIICEADAYAKLHKLNFVALCDGDEPDKFHKVLNCAPLMMGEYCINLYQDLPDEVRKMISEGPDDEQQDKPKWSILWGLFTKY